MSLTRYRVWYMSHADRQPVPRYCLTSASSPTSARRCITEASPWVTVLGVQDASVPLPEQGGPRKPWGDA